MPSRSSRLFHALAQGLVALACASAARGEEDTWALRPPISSARYALSATTAPDGSIYVIGGADSSVTGIVESFSPATGIWTPGPSLPSPQYRSAAATGGDGRIYAIGGFGGNSVLALTPGDDHWVAVAPMPTARQLFAATAGADGRIYVFGGYANGNPLDVLEIYDPATDQWTTGTPMPTPRYALAVAAGPDGRIYAIGGSGGGPNNVLDIVEAYIPATNSWTWGGWLPRRRTTHSAAAGSDGRIYVTGGCVQVYPNCPLTTRVDVYSPPAQTWFSARATLSSHWEGATASSGNRVYAIAGHTRTVESLVIDSVIVGAPANGCDAQSRGCFGAVADAYQISKFEVTNAEYSEFLNAVAAADPNDLYNGSMASDATFGGITRSGSPGSFSYLVKSGFAKKPVVYVSWYDALRFANWLHNGKGNGSTEDGAYTITAQRIADNSITRNPGARSFLPSEDEWYKAAYYDVAQASYFDYPTGTDIATDCALPVPGQWNDNRANCWPATSPQGGLTEFGAYGDYSDSPSGTSDQGGNVREWNESVPAGSPGSSLRGVRGGSWDLDTSQLAASNPNDGGNPADEDHAIGFRVAPEPSSHLLSVSGILCLIVLARRRKRRAWRGSMIHSGR